MLISYICQKPQELENQSDSELIRNLLIVIATIILLIILKEMAFILIPLAMSIFLAALLVPPFMRLKNWKVPNYLAIMIVILTIGGTVRIGGVILQLTKYEYSLKNAELDSLVETKLLPTLENVGRYTGVDLGKDIEWNRITNVVSSGKFIDSVSPVVDMFNSLVGMYIMIF